MGSVRDMRGRGNIWSKSGFQNKKANETTDPVFQEVL